MYKIPRSAAFILLFLFSGALTFGQGFYFKAGGGYAIAVSKRNFSSYTFNGVSADPRVASFKISNNTVVERNEVADSYGKGASAQIGIGYAFNKNIALEMNFSYFLGSNIKPDFIEIEDFKVDFRTKMKSFVFSPHLVISPDMPGAFKPYAKIGGTLFFASKIESKVSRNDANGNFILRDELTQGVSFGPSCALGLDFNLSDHVSVYGEACLYLLSYTPKNEKMIEYNINGVNIIPTLPSNEWELKKEISSQDDPDQIREAYTLPLSGLNFNLGIKYAL